MKLDVLIVDDDPTVRFVLAGVIESEGWGVQTAADGREAISLLAETAFDVVVADLDMPHVGGVELLRHIKSESPTTFVILMTGHPDRDGGVSVMKQGAGAYLIKPFDIDELVIKLRPLERLEAEHSAQDGAN